jgi:hypothetical protein
MQMQYADTGDWIMSRVAGEGAPTYHYTGIAYRVLEVPAPVTATTPLYRCLDAHGTHYQSPLAACESEGSTFESLLGYVYKDDPGNGAQQVWRCIAPTGRPIISTVNLQDCSVGGFIVQFAVGWAYPASFGNASAP